MDELDGSLAPETGSLGWQSPGISNNQTTIIGMDFANGLNVEDTCICGKQGSAGNNSRRIGL